MLNNKNLVNRSYDFSVLLDAARKVHNENVSIYKAAKLYEVPWSTLKDFLKSNPDVEHAHQNKMGRPFALTGELETKLFSYITEMQDLGFGLTVIQIRKLAYDLAKAAGREKFFNCEKEMASKWWWAKYKSRYNLTLRQAENLSAHKRNVDSSAKCLTPPSELDLQEASTSSSRSQRSISKKCRQIQDDAVQHNDDWVCGVCQGRYSDDEKKKTGAKWIECCFCVTPYHEKCQIGPFEDVYMCDKCDKYNENSYSD